MFCTEHSFFTPYTEQRLGIKPTFVILLKRVTAILLMLCLSCQCLVKLGIVAWFGINREYIARNLCENKDKPELNCCGKCYLKKELKKADAEEKKQDTTRSAQAELVAFVLPDRNQPGFSRLYLIKSVQNPAADTRYGILYHARVFHPPTAMLS